MRRGDKWGPASGARKPALEVLHSEVPGKSMWLHARSVPFWVGRDVDGIETICRAAGVAPPGFLVPPWRLFAETFEEFAGELHEWIVRSNGRGRRSIASPAQALRYSFAYSL